MPFSPSPCEETQFFSPPVPLPSHKKIRQEQTGRLRAAIGDALFDRLDHLVPMYERLRPFLRVVPAAKDFRTGDVVFPGKPAGRWCVRHPDDCRLVRISWPPETGMCVITWRPADRDYRQPTLAEFCRAYQIPGIKRRIPCKGI